ncbi:MAG: hypothetical protein IPJ90_13675 [Anaerolineaceae bacterium]|nr:hypothetical protein [Anaerolineaceae bacterium]
MMKVRYALLVDVLVLVVVALGCLFNMIWVHNMLGIPRYRTMCFCASCWERPF